MKIHTPGGIDQMITDGRIEIERGNKEAAANASIDQKIDALHLEQSNDEDPDFEARKKEADEIFRLSDQAFTIVELKIEELEAEIRKKQKELFEAEQEENRNLRKTLKNLLPLIILNRKALIEKYSDFPCAQEIVALYDKLLSYEQLINGEDLYEIPPELKELSREIYRKLKSL